MPLDPEAKMLLEQLTAVVRPFDELSVDEARAAIATLSAAAGEGEAVARVENRALPGPLGEIPVRVYTPEGRAPFPLLVYFHGGGWVIGSLETHDGICRRLANAAGAVVVSVDYRLPPEHPFPASGEDAYAATPWFAANAARLRAAGSQAHVRRYAGMIHGFFGMGPLLTKAREATKDAAEALRAAFSAR